jgi:hypothetical protein
MGDDAVFALQALLDLRRGGHDEKDGGALASHLVGFGKGGAALVFELFAGGCRAVPNQQWNFILDEVIGNALAHVAKANDADGLFRNGTSPQNVSRATNLID